MIFTPFGQFRLETNRFRFKDRIDSNLDFFSIERNKFHKNTQPLGYLHVCGFLCEGEPGQESFLFHLNRPNILKNYTHRISHRFLLLGGKNHEKLILRNLFGTNSYKLDKFLCPHLYLVNHRYLHFLSAYSHSKNGRSFRTLETRDLTF